MRLGGSILEITSAIVMLLKPLQKKINEDQLMTKTKAIHSDLATANNQSSSLSFGKDSKAGRGVGKLYIGKRKGFRSISAGDCHHGKAADQLGSRESYVTGHKCIFGFFVFVIVQLVFIVSHKCFF